MKAIVGLGNPAASYGRTRHNAGFWVVDRLAERYRMRFSARRYRSRVATGKIGETEVLLVKPETYMNLSGEAVGRARRDLGLDPPDILVVYDDADLPLGRVRVRASGGAGGHHGVESVIESLGAKHFPRVRVGIGRPGEGKVPVDFLLDAPDEEELAMLRDAVDRAADAAEVWLREGVAAAMNRFNGLREPPC